MMMTFTLLVAERHGIPMANPTDSDLPLLCLTPAQDWQVMPHSRSLTTASEVRGRDLGPGVAFPRPHWLEAHVLPV